MHLSVMSLKCEVRMNIDNESSAGLVSCGGAVGVNGHSDFITRISLLQLVVLVHCEIVILFSFYFTAVLVLLIV